MATTELHKQRRYAITLKDTIVTDTTLFLLLFCALFLFNVLRDYMYIIPVKDFDGCFLKVMLYLIC